MEKSLAIVEPESFELAVIGQIEQKWRGFAALPVESHDDYQDTIALRAALKADAKRLEGVRKDYTRPLDDLKKRAMRYFEQYEAMLVGALGSIDGAMLTWNEFLRKQREEEQRKLEEHIKRQEAEERARLEADAAKALESGNIDKAEALVEKSLDVNHAVPILAPAKAIGKGAATKKITRYEITDANAVPRELCEPSAAKIRNMVNIVGAKGSIPGVRIWEEEIISQVRA